MHLFRARSTRITEQIFEKLLKKDTFPGRNLGEAAAECLALITPENDVYF